jgi:hypothetical protein
MLRIYLARFGRCLLDGDRLGGGFGIALPHDVSLLLLFGERYGMTASGDGDDMYD